MNTVRLSILSGISQHFHNKNQFEIWKLWVFHTVQAQFRNACQKGVSSLFAEGNAWSTAMRSNSPGPSLLSGKKPFALIKCFVLILLNIRLFFFNYGASLVIPKKHFRSLLWSSRVAVSWWPTYHSKQNPAIWQHSWCFR